MCLDAEVDGLRDSNSWKLNKIHCESQIRVESNGAGSKSCLAGAATQRAGLVLDASVDV